MGTCFGIILESYRFGENGGKISPHPEVRHYCVRAVDLRSTPPRPEKRANVNHLRRLRNLICLRRQCRISAPRCVGPEPFAASVTPAELRDLRRDALIDLRVVTPRRSPLPQTGGLDRSFSSMKAAPNAGYNSACKIRGSWLTVASIACSASVRKLFMTCQRRKRRLRRHGRIARTTNFGTVHHCPDEQGENETEFVGGGLSGNALSLNETIHPYQTSRNDQQQHLILHCLAMGWA